MNFDAEGVGEIETLELVDVAEQAVQRFVHTEFIGDEFAALRKEVGIQMGQIGAFARSIFQIVELNGFDQLAQHLESDFLFHRFLHER
jgi:hypothetical protein